MNGTNASNFIRILRTRSLFTGHCETVLSVIASAFTEISPFVGKYSEGKWPWNLVKTYRYSSNFVVHNDAPPAFLFASLSKE